MELRYTELTRDNTLPHRLWGHLHAHNLPNMLWPQGFLDIEATNASFATPGSILLQMGGLVGEAITVEERLDTAEERLRTSPHHDVRLSKPRRHLHEAFPGVSRGAAVSARGAREAPISHVGGP